MSDFSSYGWSFFAQSPAAPELPEPESVPEMVFEDDDAIADEA